MRECGFFKMFLFDNRHHYMRHYVRLAKSIIQ